LKKRSKKLLLGCRGPNRHAHVAFLVVKRNPACGVVPRDHGNRAATRGTATMLRYAILFAIISIIAGVLGFSGISAATAGIARIFFFIAIVIFLLFLILAVTGVNLLS
jgi:uncharacterized membrane protein YtjA (UPF0391 family)